jgi:hypothetical protein
MLDRRRLSRHSSTAYGRRVALQSFTPDDEYCVYCHAPAAGPCAECGALCCGDCVDVVLQLSIPRAVCQSCLGQRDVRPSFWQRVASGLTRLLRR